MRLRENCFSISSSFYTISIPSGAIKRENLYSDIDNLNSFQFLLVRLRARIDHACSKQIIPFQFLLVRLRVRRTSIFLKHLAEFQFLLVRLREFTFITLRELPFVFQFLLVRLRVHRMKPTKTEKANFNSFWCD